jgi:hypothetical protein
VKVDHGHDTCHHTYDSKFSIIEGVNEMIRKWNVFVRNHTSPALGVVEAITKTEAEEIGVIQFHCMVDAGLVRVFEVAA